jgi:hypothetical protein
VSTSKEKKQNSHEIQKHGNLYHLNYNNKIIIIIIIQFFIYLRPELNSLGPITESARNMKTNNNTATKQNTHKEDKTKDTNKHKKKTRTRQKMLMLIKL